MYKTVRPEKTKIRTAKRMSHSANSQLFAKSWVFRQFLIVFMTVYSQQSTIKVRRGLEHVFKSLCKSKEEKRRFLDKIASTQQCFPAVMNSQNPNSGVTEILLLHSQHYSSVKIRRAKIVLITAAKEASCCFILMSGVMVEAEMYDTNNKCSVDLSELKKERCLRFWKLAYFDSKFISNEPNT